MRTYKCFYNGKTGEVQAETTYKAQVAYAEANNVPARNRYKITVYLVAQADGTPVVHTADF